MQIKNLSIVLAFVACAMNTIASPIPDGNQIVSDIAEASNDEVSDKVNVDLPVNVENGEASLDEAISAQLDDNIEDSGVEDEEIPTSTETDVIPEDKVDDKIEEPKTNEKEPNNENIPETSDVEDEEPSTGNEPNTETDVKEEPST
ncbi:hypothetical protein PIROE2DRAFT_19074, partial [Piromyces sp. E2]